MEHACPIFSDPDMEGYFLVAIPKEKQSTDELVAGNVKLEKYENETRKEV